MNEWNENAMEKDMEKQQQKKRQVESKGKQKKALKGFSTDFETWIIFQV